MIEGRLRLDTWEDKQTNQKRSKLGVVLEGFQFLDSGRTGDEAGGAPRARTPSSSSPAAPSAQGPEPSVPAEDGPGEDDVPF
jgi:single-strand DNA-binding protein